MKGLLTIRLLLYCLNFLDTVANGRFLFRVGLHAILVRLTWESLLIKQDIILLFE